MKKIEPTCSTCRYWFKGAPYPIEGQRGRIGGLCIANKDSFFVWGHATICDNKYEENTEAFIERKSW